MQSDVTESADLDTKSDKAPHQAKPAKHILKNLLSSLVILLLGGAGLSLYLIATKHTGNESFKPFNNDVISSADFPLYYPTHLPSGFKIDPKSVNSPEKGVIVMTLIGPGDKKLYVSQQNRPSKFDLGGYYKNFLSGKQKVTDNGVIATGYIDGGKTVIGSIATKKTWILTNSVATDNVKPDQLERMLDSLTIAHATN